MIRLLMLTMLVAVASVGCASAAGSIGTIATEGDRFTGTTSRSLAGLWLTRSDTAILSELSGVQVGKSVILMVRSVNTCWSWLKCNDVSFIADKSAFTIQGKHDGSHFYEERCNETLSLTLDAAQIASLANAKSIEFRACNAESALSPAQAAQLRAFLAPAQQ
jgi:hypothetical protein